MFTIAETPSYPKLRTNYGYIDMRDRVKMPDLVGDFPLRVMEKEEVAKHFDGTVKEVEHWITECNN